MLVLPRLLFFFSQFESVLFWKATIVSFFFLFCLSLPLLKPCISISFPFLLLKKHCSCRSHFRFCFITEKKSSKWFCVTAAGVNCCLSPGAHITTAGLLLLCYMMQFFNLTRMDYSPPLLRGIECDVVKCHLLVWFWIFKAMNQLLSWNFSKQRIKQIFS